MELTRMTAAELSAALEAETKKHYGVDVLPTIASAGDWGYRGRISLVVEVTDGTDDYNAATYRVSFFYDLAKAAKDASKLPAGVEPGGFLGYGQSASGASTRRSSASASSTIATSTPRATSSRSTAT